MSSRFCRVRGFSPQPSNRQTVNPPNKHRQSCVRQYFYTHIILYTCHCHIKTPNLLKPFHHHLSKCQLGSVCDSEPLSARTANPFLVAQRTSSVHCLAECALTLPLSTAPHEGGHHQQALRDMQYDRKAKFSRPISVSSRPCLLPIDSLFAPYKTRHCKENLSHTPRLGDSQPKEKFFWSQVLPHYRFTDWLVKNYKTIKSLLQRLPSSNIPHLSRNPRSVHGYSQ